MKREKLKNRRIALGYTQEHVASKAGINRAFYANVENGKKNCSFGAWLRIIKVLDIPESELVEYAISNKKGA